MVKTVNFFKCYNPTTSARRLELPMAFSLQLRGALPDRAFLRDRHTNLWPIKTEKIDNVWFFCDGWEKFVQDNYLESRDVLVFQYDGDNLFDVKLLGLSGCDKEGHLYINTSVEDTKEEGGVAKAVQVADDGGSKVHDIESNEGLYHTELENETEESIHDRDDNAEEYMENLEDKDKDAEDEDGKEEDAKSNEDTTQEDDELDVEQAADGQRPLNSYGNDIFNSIKSKVIFLFSQIQKGVYT
ncbi:putative B3 domain-containing protein At5g66980 [Olea europaea var. sylvestris]|uniref:putative B3 domain-containing protein At5g66980 n=1 Tax=Olea europaea var. sylvestris TaxID=158386 RepID=UPI000C1CDDA5|nr:putative B3 domain-containing protein At5g66980 [Olea europaea var. sylvestris]